MTMRTVKTAILVLGVFSLLLGVIYPLAITGIAQLAFPHRAGGSLITRNGRVIGSELLGQAFTDSCYFHGRPSDCGYQADRSASANLGPANPALAHFSQSTSRQPGRDINPGRGGRDRLFIDRPPL